MGVVPPGYSLSEGMGSGCFLDPPGYPSYFLRYLYTPRGNNPRWGPQVYILDPEGTPRIIKNPSVLYRRLYLPLPENHPRMRLWLAAVYTHMARGYINPTGKFAPSHGKIMFWGLEPFSPKHFQDDPRFSDDYRSMESQAVTQFNQKLSQEWDRIALPENHAAVQHVRQYFPHHKPEVEWIEDPSTCPRGANWWEVFGSVPINVDECSAQLHIQHGSSYPNRWSHPVNVTWCQQCGWRDEQHG